MDEPLTFREQQLLRETRAHLCVRMVATGEYDSLIDYALKSHAGGTANYGGERGWHRASKKGISWEKQPLNSPPEHLITWDRIVNHLCLVATPPVRKKAQSIIKRSARENQTTAERRGRYIWGGEKERAKWAARRAEFDALLDQLFPSRVDWEAEDTESLPSV